MIKIISIMGIVRGILTCLLCYMVYKETGLFTAIFAIGVSIGIECNSYSIGVLKSCIKSLL